MQILWKHHFRLSMRPRFSAMIFISENRGKNRNNFFSSPPAACRGGGSRAWGGREARRPWQVGGSHQVCSFQWLGHTETLVVCLPTMGNPFTPSQPLSTGGVTPHALARVISRTTSNCGTRLKMWLAAEGGGGPQCEGRSGGLGRASGGRPCTPRVPREPREL